MKAFAFSAWVVAAAAVFACGGEDPKGSGPGPATTGWLSVETIASDDDVVVERVMYRSDGLRVKGQVCRPKAQGVFPVVVGNHGGWDGLGNDWANLGDGACGSLARLGYVVAMSSYRGEDGSDGRIEFCAGEARDVRAMLEIVRRQPYAKLDGAVMYGISHGGCVTVRAVMDGAPVVRAVSINGPADLAGVYDAAKAREAEPFFQGLMLAFEQAFGGSPSTAGGVYEARSTLPAAEKLASTPVELFFVHGVEDEVVPVDQSCRLATAAGGFRAFHIGATGTIAEPPDACADVGLMWEAGALPTGSWPGSRYLAVYDGMSHGEGAAFELALLQMLDFLVRP